MAKKTNSEMSFLDHLEVLRWHLVRSLVAILSFAIIAFIFKSVIFDVIIIAPKTPEFPTNRFLCMLGQEVNIQRLCINSQPFPLQTVKMAEQFAMHIVVSLIGGVIISFPYVFWEFWRFIKPAMYDKEKRTASGAVFYTSLLFMMGVAFGYYLIAPLSVHFLGNYRVSEEVVSNPTLRSYVQTVSSVVLASGIVFELPVLSYFLTKIGLITPAFLKKYRRHSLVLILALSALITPPDIFSQVMVSMPLIVLYEVGIGISKRIVKRQEEKEAEESR
ncbi:MAG: twin-arginine translocase subunit TatC [Bacteroidales bacterium]|nr:twin-arginine translocase subunit TatC [Bacteroidales bacterium]